MGDILQLASDSEWKFIRPHNLLQTFPTLDPHHSYKAMNIEKRFHLYLYNYTIMVYILWEGGGRQVIKRCTMQLCTFCLHMHTQSFFVSKLQGQQRLTEQ